MVGPLHERLLVDADRLVPVAALRRGHGREHRLPGGDRVRLPRLAAEREHDGVRVERDRAALQRGSRTKTSSPGPSSCSFPSTVKRARPRSTR